MNNNAHIVVVKRYSEESGSYVYVPLGTRSTISAANKLAIKPKNGSRPGDIILVMHIDGVSDPDRSATSIYAVNSRGGIVKMGPKYQSDLDTVNTTQMYLYYDRFDGDELINRSHEYVGKEVSVRAVCECLSFCIKQEYAGITKDEFNTYSQVLVMIEERDLVRVNDELKKIRDILDKYRKEETRFGPYAVASAMRYLVEHVLGISYYGKNNHSPDYVLVEIYEASTDYDTILRDVENIVKSIITPELWMLGIAEKVK